MSENDTIQRTALGRVANVGDLYDARTDKFCAISIFSGPPVPQVIRRTSNSFTDIKYVISSSMKEKLDTLEVTAELQASVLGGLFKLEGSGKYLEDKKKSFKSVESSLLFNIKTEVERLNLFDNGLKSCVSYDALAYEKATHVVVEVHWGANSALTVKDKNTANKDKKEIEGHLQAQLKTVAMRIKGQANVDYENSDVETSRTFSFQVFGDILPDSSSELPTTFEGAVEMMSKMTTYIRQCNDGKGKPLSFVLFPLSSPELKNHFGISALADRVLCRLDETAILRFVEMFDQISEMRQLVHDQYEELDQYHYCLTRAELQEVRSLKVKLEETESRLRGNLASLLTEVRSGNKGASALEALREDYYASTSSAHALSTRCTDVYRATRPKIDFVKLCSEYGAIHLDHADATSLANIGVRNDHAYVLFADLNIVSNQETWLRNHNTFFSLMKSKPPSTSFFYTWTAHDGGVRIEHYRSGFLVTTLL